MSRKEIEFTFPYNFHPRGYQLELWQALHNQYNGAEKVPDAIRKFIYVWHRRAGKDLLALNWIISEMVKNVGTYWHIFPEFSQGS